MYFDLNSLFFSLSYFLYMSSRKEILNRLDYYHHIIQATILSKQHPASGLMPASTAITVSFINSKKAYPDTLSSFLDTWRLY